jgi:hypothetical protein
VATGTPPRDQLDELLPPGTSVPSKHGGASLVTLGNALVAVGERRQWPPFAQPLGEHLERIRGRALRQDGLAAPFWALWDWGSVGPRMAAADSARHRNVIRTTGNRPETFRYS